MISHLGAVGGLVVIFADILDLEMVEFGPVRNAPYLPPRVPLLRR